MKAVTYIPPETGGQVTLTISAELARLIQGMIGTISAIDLQGLRMAGAVREEISEVHRELDALLGGSQWKRRGQVLRLGPDA